ncbi:MULTISPECIES: hypothetical protein [unclassified Nostoc]|uniref:hypothetical protein n=1 Tax=unclassified Nostoc TaxID=2593658 RepID=UPI002AD30197|nr:hypothetical protein [Nostoc sp. DedQUE03]MDZ7975937.1 hypothetical protein [Nostoc sp. DedQUE03]MDZ8044772.1 hypothetical protein [Nostoc sp. DedQUE02]
MRSIFTLQPETAALSRVVPQLLHPACRRPPDKGQPCFAAASKCWDVRIISYDFQSHCTVVNASTTSKGNGGNITIDARDRIFIDGVSTTGFSSGLFSTVNQDAVGNAGNIKLTTTDFLFLNRGGISSSSFGQGKAGDININSVSTALDNKAFIEAITNSGDGGNINLTASDRLLLRRGSGISTTAGTAKYGGNIDIDSRFIIAIPEENSDISANAFSGTTILLMGRGNEGFFVINKGENKFNIPVLDLTLTNLDRCYRELRNNFTVAIEYREQGKKFITRWVSWNRGGMEVQKRDALYFIREPFNQCQV